MRIDRRPAAGDPRRAPSRAARAAALGLVLFAAAALPLRAEAIPAGPEREKAALEVEQGLMCHCGCTDLTVRVCNCGVAAGIKDDIRERLGAGQSKADVIAAYVARYGAQIRSAPSRQGFDLLAWWMPFVAVFTAGAFLVVLVRRWARRPLPAPAPAEGPGAPRDASLERVDRVMREIL
jgi:cytochrome c-type biogenesis protein CcmH